MTQAKTFLPLLVAGAFVVGAGVRRRRQGQRCPATTKSPPVKTAAKGSGTITIADDGAVSGSVTTTGVAGHDGPHSRGRRGRQRPGDRALHQGRRHVQGARRARSSRRTQMASFKAGNLYVNVHSDANRAAKCAAS